MEQLASNSENTLTMVHIPGLSSDRGGDSDHRPSPRQLRRFLHAVAGEGIQTPTVSELLTGRLLPDCHSGCHRLVLSVGDLAAESLEPWAAILGDTGYTSLAVCAADDLEALEYTENQLGLLLGQGVVIGARGIDYAPLVDSSLSELNQDLRALRKKFDEQLPYRTGTLYPFPTALGRYADELFADRASEFKFYSTLPNYPFSDSAVRTRHLLYHSSLPPRQAAAWVTGHPFQTAFVEVQKVGQNLWRALDETFRKTSGE